AYAGEPVPTLAATHAWLAAAGMLMNVEIKPAPGYEAITGRVVAQTLKRVYEGSSAIMPLLSSFSAVALEAAAAAAPALPRAMLWDAIPADWQARVDDLGCVGVHCHHRQLSAAMAGEVRRRGLGLLCYTVNDAVRADTLF